MINYFDADELEKNHLRKEPHEYSSTVWYIYDKRQEKSLPVRVIKEIPFEHTQLYREIQYEDNPHIVKILDVARLDEKFILEMEYANGIVIGEFIEELWQNRLQCPMEERIDLALQICGGLKTCHTLGIVHRDISENNVILTKSGDSWQTVLIDFGNLHKIRADAKKDTTAVGTIGYAAPEQLGYSASDSATDIYAVGVLMCRLFTGKGREGVEEIENDTVRNIIKRCIRLEKNERYRDIDSLMADLRNASRFFRKWEKKSENRIVDSLLQFMDEEFNIDFANAFLETPDPIPMPIYVVLMASILIAFVLAWFLPWYFLPVCYFPYQYIVGGYFKKRLEGIRFYYPFSQKMSEISKSINLLLTVNQIQYEVLNESEMRIDLEGRSYIVKVDLESQCLGISSDWGLKLADIKLAFCMMEDFGKIVYLFQHLYRW